MQKSNSFVEANKKITPRHSGRTRLGVANEHTTSLNHRIVRPGCVGQASVGGGMLIKDNLNTNNPEENLQNQ